MIDSRKKRVEPKPKAVDNKAKSQIKAYKESLILDVAATLFYEKGFQRTTLDDIGAVLDVTKPFIYTYFESKHQILERLFDQVYKEVYDGAIAASELDSDDPVLRFKHFVAWYIRKNLDRRQFSAILLEEEKNLGEKKIAEIRLKQRKFDNRLAKLVQDGVKTGAFSTEEPKLASLAISGMVRWTHRWYSVKGRLSADELVEKLTGFALQIVGWSDQKTVDYPVPKRKRTPNTM